MELHKRERSGLGRQKTEAIFGSFSLNYMIDRVSNFFEKAFLQLISENSLPGIYVAEELLHFTQEKILEIR